MTKTFKYRIYSNSANFRKAAEWIENCRILYNLCLEQRISAYKNYRKYVSWYQQCRELTDLKNEFNQFNLIDRETLENVLKRLDRTYQAFFRRIKSGEKSGFPRFKSIDRYDSFTMRNTGWKLKGKYFTITKIGKFKIKLSRPIEGKIKEVTIKRKNDKWFISFICIEVPTNPLPKTNKQIGIDVGCESFLTDSNSDKIPNPRFFKKAEDNLINKQKTLSKKVKGSNRRKKAKILLSKAHEKVFNQRKDFHYKVANYLLKNNDTIYIEKLQSWNSYRALNRSMRDVAWFQFFNILKCKAEEAGRKVIEVPAKNTSQMCSSCGKLVPKDLSIRVHSCACGLIIDRDYNAALNIYRLGQSLRTVSV